MSAHGLSAENRSLSGPAKAGGRVFNFLGCLLCEIHTHSRSYLKAIISGDVRFDLCGRPAGAVADTERRHVHVSLFLLVTIIAFLAKIFEYVSQILKFCA